MPLTLAQVLPGLPSVEHGGSVDIMGVLPPHLQEALKHPEKIMVEPPQGPRPRPKVRVVDGEWPKIARALFDRGLVRPVNHCPVLDGEKVQRCIRRGEARQGDRERGAGAATHNGP